MAQCNCDRAYADNDGGLWCRYQQHINPKLCRDCPYKQRFEETYRAIPTELSRVYGKVYKIKE